MKRKERKEICKGCSSTEESPHYLSGIGTVCQECGIYQAWGEFEFRDGQWRSFATYR